ncbi:MAG TPA: thiol reductant ABC exporter subunit CydC [Solirubrobacteraceae bacterium]|nr:thiol reductant ABC exporter subunit CydC [Solirubrobacteraceae bacterium]
MRTAPRILAPASRRLLLSCLLGACALGAGIGLLATAAWLISRAAQHPHESALALGIVAVQFFGLSKGLARYGQRLVGHDAALRALADLRVRIYRALEPLAPSGLAAFRSGELMARFVDDVDSLQDLLVRVIAPFGVAILVGVGTVALEWAVLPAAGAIVAVALVLAATVVPWTTNRLARRTEATQAQVRGELSAAVVEAVRAAPELMAYGAMQRKLEAAQAIDARLARIARRGAVTAGIGQGLATLLPALATFGCLLVGVSAVRAGRLDVVFLAVIAIVPLAAFELASPLPAATQTLSRVRASLGRVSEVLEAEPVVVEPPRPRSLPAGPGAHAIRVRGLGCRYGDGGALALDGVDLDLSTGRRVAVVGRSGAGKSTLARVLLRLAPYQYGSVSLDGIELSELAGDACRRVVGLLSQDAHVFDTTIRANLRLARRDASDEQLREALQATRLFGWVDRLPAGLDTAVGELGERMSGGERQRLAAARVLLADFPVMVLDEPGEHLDTATADAIVADVLDAASGRAVLLITHRLAGLHAADEVIVLDGGRVVQRGTHDELAARPGVYADMWRREQGLG